jgi:hypothetical protein
MSTYLERRRKDQSRHWRFEDESGSSQDHSLRYSSPFQEVTREPCKERVESRPFLADQTELPGVFKKREDGQIEYWTEDGDLCIFKQPRAVSWSPRLQSATLHSNGHIYITESLACPEDLPKHSPRMPFGLTVNYKMCVPAVGQVLCS